MEHNEKEARFDIYCKYCKHFEKEETESPCNECLESPANDNSHNPVKYEEDKPHGK